MTVYQEGKYSQEWEWVSEQGNAYALKVLDHETHDPL